MLKIINKHGVSIAYDTENVSDIFATNNAVYMLSFPTNDIYIGSCCDLSDRISKHCYKSSNKRVFCELEKYKKAKLTVLGVFDKIDSARECESRLIAKYATMDNIMNIRK